MTALIWIGGVAAALVSIVTVTRWIVLPIRRGLTAVHELIRKLDANDTLRAEMRAGLASVRLQVRNLEAAMSRVAGEREQQVTDLGELVADHDSQIGRLAATSREHARQINELANAS